MNSADQLNRLFRNLDMNKENGLVAQDSHSLTAYQKRFYKSVKDKLKVNAVYFLRSNGEFLFAQVHSHPGIAFHSDDDCNEAISYKKGFISIVVPDYGQNMNGLDVCAIFEYVGNGIWDELSTKIVNERFTII